MLKKIYRPFNAVRAGSALILAFKRHGLNFGQFTLRRGLYPATSLPKPVALAVTHTDFRKFYE